MPASSRGASFYGILGAVSNVVNRRRDRTASRYSAAQCSSYGDNRRDNEPDGHEGHEAGHHGHGDENWSEIDHCEHAELPFRMLRIIRPGPGLNVARGLEASPDASTAIGGERGQM